MKDTKYTAYHEAGHAVIGRVLGMECGLATIIRNKTEGYDGRAIVHEPHTTQRAWEDRGKKRKFKSVVCGLIITKMAGGEAETELLGARRPGDRGDRGQIAHLIRTELPNAKEPRLRRMTVMLVRRHRAAIEAVANDLLKRRKLYNWQIDAVVRRSLSPRTLKAFPISISATERHGDDSQANRLKTEPRARGVEGEQELSNLQTRLDKTGAK